MGKKVLILSGSPRRGGNSDLLCDEFLRGASEAGNDVEKIFISEKRIDYCTSCGSCYIKRTKCVIDDDMAEIIDKMIAADVLVMSTPVYFYAMSGQMKVLIDRTISRCMEINNKDIYFILSAHDDKQSSMERVLEGFRGYTACLKGITEKGIVYGLGVFDTGEIKTKPAMTEAFQMGKDIK